MDGRKIVIADKRVKLHSFRLRKPKSLDAELLADRLMRLALVSEIVLDCNGQGYSLDVRFAKRMEASDAHSYLAVRISREFGTLTGR